MTLVQKADQPPTRQELRNLWVSVRGVFHGVNPEQATISEPNLIILLTELTRPGRRGGTSWRELFATLHLEPDAHEALVRRLVEAICPGLDSGDLLADGATAAEAALALHSALAAAPAATVKVSGPRHRRYWLNMGQGGQLSLFGEAA